jgi:molecular chaperone GrpE
MDDKNINDNNMLNEEIKAEEEMQSQSCLLCEEKEAKIAHRDDQFKRLAADFINYKKNVEKEKERLLEFREKLLLQEIIEIHYHMEKALSKYKQTNDSSKDPLYAGIEIFKKEMDKVIGRHGLIRKNTIGEVFDPQFHEAIQTKEDSEKPHNTIIEEYSPLYVKNGECYFHAKVLVAMNDKSTEPESESASNHGPEE